MGPAQGNLALARRYLVKQFEATCRTGYAIRMQNDGNDDPAESDEQLIRKALCKLDDAPLCQKQINLTVAVLYQRHAEHLLAFIQTRVRNPATSDDIAQETWIKIAKALARFHGDHFRAWTFTIARNEITNYFRKNKIATLLPDVETPGPCIEDGDADPFLDALGDCLQSLIPARAAIVRLAMEGYRHQDIAERLNIPVDTVSTRYHRGKNDLRECIQGKIE